MCSVFNQPRGTAITGYQMQSGQDLCELFALKPIISIYKTRQMYGISVDI